MQGQGKRRLLLPRLYTVVQTTHPQTLGAVESAHFHVLNLKGLEAELTKSTKRHCAKKTNPSYVRSVSQNDDRPVTKQLSFAKWCRDETEIETEQPPGTERRSRENKPHAVELHLTKRAYNYTCQGLSY